MNHFNHYNLLKSFLLLYCLTIIFSGANQMAMPMIKFHASIILHCVKTTHTN